MQLVERVLGRQPTTGDLRKRGHELGEPSLSAEPSTVPQRHSDHEGEEAVAEHGPLRLLSKIRERREQQQAIAEITNEDVFDYIEEAKVRGRVLLTFGAARERLTSTVIRQRGELRELGITAAEVEACHTRMWELAPWGSHVSRIKAQERVIKERRLRAEAEANARAWTLSQRVETRKRALDRGVRQKTGGVKPAEKESDSVLTRICQRPLHAAVRFATVTMILVATTMAAVRPLEAPSTTTEDPHGAPATLTDPSQRETYERFLANPEGLGQEDLASLPPEATLSLLTERGDLDLAETIEAYLPNPPIRFVVAETEQPVGEYHQRLNIRAENPPERLLRWLNVIEGPISQSAPDLLAKILVRNIKTFISEKGYFSGASHPGTQLVEILGGFYNHQPLLNPDHPAAFHYPQKYGLTYLTRLVWAAFMDRPQELDKGVSSLAPVSLKDTPMPQDKIHRAINVLCAKLESYLMARKLIGQYGESEVLKAYVNFVPLGSVSGLPVFGLETASRFLFGKSLDQLNGAETLVVIGSIQAPAEYMYSQESAVDRAITVLDILRRKGQISPEEYDQIKDQLAQVNFSYLTPEEYLNLWFNSSTDLPHILKQQVYEYLALAREGKLTPAMVGPDETTFRLHLPLPIPSRLDTLALGGEQALTPFSLERPALQDRLDTHIRKHLTQTDGGLTFSLKDGRKIEIPFFEQGGTRPAGLAVVVLDGKTGEILGQFDETGQLSEYPTPIGSTIKPFITAFLLSVGYDLKTPIANAPGNYALVHEVLTVRNAVDSLNIDSPENKIDLELALAYSANVPFQVLLKEYLSSHPGGWLQLQAFLSRFGLELKDAQGRILGDPTDYAAIGSDVYVSSLVSLARAYSMLANPEKYFSNDPGLVADLKRISEILADQELKKTQTPGGKRVWTNLAMQAFNPDLNGGRAFFKTGTVSYADTTTDLLTCGVVRTNDGRLVALATRVAGQKDGRPISLKGVSSEIPLPITRELLEFVASSNEPAMESYPPERAISLLTDFWRTKTLGLTDYRLATTREKTMLYDRFGNSLGFLDAGQIVDIIGKPKNGLQEVVLHLGEMITTTFAREESLITNRDDLGSQKPEASRLIELAQAARDAYPEIRHPQVNFIIVGPNETSPFLFFVYKSLEARNLIMAGSEDFRQVLNQMGLRANNVVFVNQPLLRTYLGEEEVKVDNLTLPRRALVDIIVSQEEYLKVQTILNQSRTNIAFDTLFWNSSRPTPTQVLISALAEYRLGLNTRGNERSKMIGDLVRYSPGRLGEIYRLYSQLMGDLDKGRPIMTRQAQRLISLFTELNNSPTPQELKILGTITVVPRLNSSPR